MKEKEETKAYTVRFKPSLMAKVEAYVGLVKANKEAKEPSLSKTKFFNELLEDFFSNKVLDKEFIELSDLKTDNIRYQRGISRWCVVMLF